MPTVIDLVDYVIALRQKIQQLEQELQQIKTINKAKK
jgi:AmiR/NasT family two-component response regulator